MKAVKEGCLCLKCVKLKDPIEVTCRVFKNGSEPGKTGKCWSYSEDPDFFRKVAEAVKRYEARYDDYKIKGKIRRIKLT